MKCSSVPLFEVWCCLFVFIQIIKCIEEISAPVHTGLVCGWETLKAECGFGEVIHFLRANYGRTSLLHCNGDNIQWDVDCDFPESNEIVKRRCDGKLSCEVPATTSVFGDPCVGIQKYLEMDFQCRPGKPHLFTADVNGIRVIDMETYEDFLLTKEPTRAAALDYVYHNKTIVWTDSHKHRICSAPIRTNQSMTTLLNDAVQPDGLTVDWIQDKLYWTDTGKNTIGVAKLDGRWEKTLFDTDLQEPRSIVVDPLEGWMFWTNSGDAPKIERAGMDGSHRSVIVSSQIQRPNGVAVDLSFRRVYWVDAGTHDICRVNYDGSGRTTVISSTSLLKEPVSITIFESDMYWLDLGSSEGSIYKADKSSGKYAKKIVTGRKWKYIMDIKVFHETQQPAGSNRCGDANGGCSHLCLPTPRFEGVSPPDSKAYACACPNNIQLASNGVDCLTKEGTHLGAEEPKEEIPIENPLYADITSTERAIILYANKEDIRRLDLATMEDMLLSNDFIEATSIDYFYAHKLCIWTDVERQKIYSAPLWTGKPITTLVEDVKSNGVAVDWIHDNIYWTDIARSTIEVARLDGTMRKTLFEGEDVEQPTTIALHPLDGWIFWLAGGRVPKIERAGMDGSNRKIVALARVDWIYALTIDLDFRKIFWANGEEKKIFSANFDGSEQRTVFQAVNLLQRPFSMDVLHDDIYWTEGLPSAENIFRTNKHSGNNAVKVNSKVLTQIMGIKIHHSSKQPLGHSRCLNNNGGCSHLCLPTPRLPHVSTNYTCSCPDEESLHSEVATCLTDVDIIYDRRGEFIRPVYGTIIVILAGLVLIALIGIIVYCRCLLKK